MTRSTRGSGAPHPLGFEAVHAPEAAHRVLGSTLRAQAAAVGHRSLLILSGDAAWTAGQAIALVAALPGIEATWLSERALTTRTRPLRAAGTLLGTDLDLLVYDAWSGFDPDGFGAATGAIRGGGLLILLTPPLEAWADHLDPQAERIAVWPHTADAVGRRFVRRLSHIVRAGPGVIHLTQPQIPASARPWTLATAAPGIAPQQQAPLDGQWQPTLNPSQPATSDQARAIEAIVKVGRGETRNPLVIRAHRGRGKSAALGLAAARLRAMGMASILVTAPRRDAVATLFRHLDAEAYGSSDAHNTCRPRPTARARRPADPQGIRFLSPADLVAERPSADLLLVDEAAGIPTPLLEALLTRYPRVVFATTVHGYEGTGRGFDVRFSATLERLAPGWDAVTLTAPIRWALGDPLEALVFRALLLDAAPAPPAEIAAFGDDTPTCERLDRDALARDEHTLRELFGLLVLAHYQTRPLDLRMALDGPNIRVYAARIGRHLVGTLLAAQEGGFSDPTLCEAIYRGERRPRGHLLPQTLSTHAGLAEAPTLHMLRVVRIAIHPAYARRGIGRRLLRTLQGDGHAECIDLVGASFGATPELVSFWRRCGYRPVHLGTRRNAASGEHAVVVVRRLTARGRAFTIAAESRFAARLAVLLAGPLRDLDPGVAAAILGAMRLGACVPPIPGLGSCMDIDRELDGFVSGHRSLDATLPLLSELTRRHLGAGLHTGGLDLEDAALLVAATCQLRPMAELVAQVGASGRDALITRLREAAGRLRGSVLDRDSIPGS